jgi:phosphoglycolate phosphatase-like HAD superfamily hydrolase
VIGDTASDVMAATNAGARPILLPKGATRQQDIDAAPVVARSFAAAARLVL